MPTFFIKTQLQSTCYITKKNLGFNLALVVVVLYTFTLLINKPQEVFISSSSTLASDAVDFHTHYCVNQTIYKYMFMHKWFYKYSNTPTLVLCTPTSGCKPLPNYRHNKL